MRDHSQGGETISGEGSKDNFIDNIDGRNVEKVSTLKPGSTEKYAHYYHQ